MDFEGLEHLPYRGDELSVAVPKGRLLARRRRVRLADRLAYEHVGLTPAAAAQTAIARAAAKAGAQINYRAIVSTFEASLRVVAAGLAVCIIPRIIAVRAPTQGAVSLVLDKPWARWRFAIAYRNHAGLHTAGARLLEYLHARHRDAA
jgi:DNA-binding transcriptional LysR family regulator